MQQFPARDTSEHKTHPSIDSMFHRVMADIYHELGREVEDVKNAVVGLSEQHDKYAVLGERFARRTNTLKDIVRHGVDGDTDTLARQARIDFGFTEPDQPMQQVISSFDDKDRQMTEAQQAINAAYSTTVSNPLQELTG